MNTRKNDPSPDEIERLLYEADQFIDGLFPQTESEVADMQSIFGSTPVELPEQLRNPKRVLEQIVQREHPAPQPTAFGKLVTMLRTEQKLSLAQLAQKTDLDLEDLQDIESGKAAASPMAVTLLGQFFRLQPQKARRLAGLTRDSSDQQQNETLSVAACAKPNFDSLDLQEKAMFHALVKQLRKKG